jgi:hypothetical protein
MVSSQQHDDADLHGQIVTLLGYEGAIMKHLARKDFWRVKAGNWKAYVSESCLVPLDGYDGNEVSSWEKGVWRPRELVRVDSGGQEA